MLLGRDLGAGGRGSARATDGTSRLAVRRLLDRVRVVGGLFAAFFGTLVASQLLVRLAHLARRVQVALGRQAGGGIGVAAVSVFEGLPFGGDEGLEFGRGDELVLGAIDELDELGERPVGAVVDEAEGRAQVAQEEQLPDAVEHVRVGRQTRFGCRFGQDPMAEAVEVGDGDPGPRRRAHGRFDPVLKLARGLDVVGEYQDLLGKQAILVGQQPADALDDDPRLAGAGTGDDHGGTVAVLDDALLLRGQRRVLALGGTRVGLRRWCGLLERQVYGCLAASTSFRLLPRRTVSVTSRTPGRVQDE